MSAYQLWIPTALDAAGNVVSTAVARFYNAGTTTPVTVYTDVSLATAAADPLPSASGVFPAVYVDSGDSIKIDVLTQSGGSSLPGYPRDNIGGQVDAAAVSRTPTGAVPADDVEEALEYIAGLAQRAFETVTAAQAATIPAALKTIIVLRQSSAVDPFVLIYKRVSADPGTTYKLRSTDRYLADGTTDATNGGWWDAVLPAGFDPISTLTALTAPALADTIAIYDASDTEAKGITPDNFLKVINLLTEDTTPDSTADFVAIYDTSAGSVKKAKPAALGASVAFISSQDASGSATLDFTVFDATKFDAYEFHLQSILPAVDDDDLGVRFRTSGGSFRTGGSDYAYSLTGQNNAGALSEVSTGASVIVLNDLSATAGVGNAAGETGVNGKIWVHSAGLAAGKTTITGVLGYYSANGGFAMVVLAGTVTTAEVNDAIRFYFAGGNIASGTITMLGIRNS